MLTLLQTGIGDTDPEAPTRAVNEAAQTFITVAAWAVALAVLVYAVRLARRQRSALPLAIVLAPVLGVVNEPLWNEAYNLFWYEPGQWTLFTSFGTPQPVWIAGIYTVIYAGPALVMLRKVGEGADRQWLYRKFLIGALSIMVLETTVINIGVYGYYGELQFRVFGPYPLWAGFMEGAFICVYGVLVARIGPLLHGWATLLIVPLFSLSFCGVFFGAGMPGIVVNNANDVPTLVQYAGVLGALALTTTVVWFVGHLLPSRRPGDRALHVEEGTWSLRPATALATPPGAPAQLQDTSA